MSNKTLLSTLALGLFTLAIVMISCNNSGPGGPNLEISEVSPEEGPIGTRVTIYGGGFVPKASDNIVTFDGTAAEVISVSPDSIVTEVPVGATSGPIEIEVDDKTVTGPSFVITEGGDEELSVVSIDPTEGPVGTQVTINGSGFSPEASENTVTFNGTIAEVTSVSGASKLKSAETETDSSQAEADKTKNVPSSGDSLSANNATEIVAVVPDGATTGPVEVTVNEETATGPEFTVTTDGGPTPSVDSIDPTEGPTGTEVTITGENFAPNAGDNTVQFGDAEATINSASETEIVAVVPNELSPGDEVPVSVTVNGQTGVGPDFTVTDDGSGDGDAPSIGGIDPTEGPTGTEVTITGENFGSNPEDNTVTFNGSEATISSASDTELVVVVPDDATTGPVEVTVDGETATGPDFTVTDDGGGNGDAPSVGSIDPTEGPTGTEVTITGENFAPNADDNTVQFGDAEAEVSSASETELTAIVPDELSPGDEVPVSVTVGGETGEGPTFTVTEGDTGGEAPSIDGINPTEGPVGTEVTISGSNFSSTADENTVTFNGSEATISSASESELVAVVPDDATTGPVAVTVDGQTATGPEFTVTDDGGGGDAPTVDSINPTEGPVGTEVTITGSNFSSTASENTVEFGSEEATVTSASETELTAEVPGALSAGDVVPVSVTVNGETATGPDFTVTDSDGGGQAPSISGINPTEGPVGTEVTISGENFSSTSSENTVEFGGSGATVNSSSETEIVAVVPDDLNAGETVDVTVAVDGQTATSPDQFTVTDDGSGGDAPIIDAIDPVEGEIGITVTITGSNFASTASENTVTFNGTEANVNSATETEIEAVVPNGATTGPVEVTVDGETATGPEFTVIAPAPVINAIDPIEGEVGTEVTITGENFGETAADNTVEFGGSEASVNSASETEIVAVVPDDLGAGAVDVTVTADGETATSPDQFTVIVPAPVIDAIDPTSGTVSTEVTITGENFSSTASENTVTFGGTEATVNSASETELVAVVPSSLSPGDYTVEVQVNGQTATAPDQFTVLEEGTPQFPITGSNASIDYGGCSLCGITNPTNVIDGNTDNYATVNLPLSISSSYWVSVESAGNIPAGGNAGFVVANEGGLIGLDLLEGITITTYLDGAEQESISDAALLNLEVVSGTTDRQFVSFPTNSEFDEIRIEFGSLLGANSDYLVYAAYGGQEAEAVPGPAINSVSPERGPAGTEVTITGSNFSATASENTVTFNGTQATISSATETELIVEVPTGATTGPVEVLTNGQTATSTDDFVVGSLPLTGSGLTVETDIDGLLGGVTCLVCEVSDGPNVIDADKDNYASVTLEAGISATGIIAVTNSETMSGGGQVGFIVARSGGAVDLGLLENITIETYLNGELQDSESGSSLALVDLFSDTSTDRKFVGFESTGDFDQIVIGFGALLSVDVEYEVYSVFDNYFVAEE